MVNTLSWSSSCGFFSCGDGGWHQTQQQNKSLVWGKGVCSVWSEFWFILSSDVALGNVFSSGLSLWLYKQSQRLAFGGTKSDLNDSTWDFCQAAPPSVCCRGFPALPLAGGLVVVGFFFFHAEFCETLLWDCLFLLKEEGKKKFAPPDGQLLLAPFDVAFICQASALSPSPLPRRQFPWGSQGSFVSHMCLKRNVELTQRLHSSTFCPPELWGP